MTVTPQETRICISIHAPRGGSDHVCAGCAGHHRNFNPRSPWGERPLKRVRWIPCSEFQSTLPVGGATTSPFSSAIAPPISIHAPRGGSDAEGLSVDGVAGISIHAPRGGSDRNFPGNQQRSGYFNPRSPWGERQHDKKQIANVAEFQSTLPVGGATGFPLWKKKLNRYFNPRSPWGERRGAIKCQQSM